MTIDGVPQLRFPEFTDEWTAVKISELVDNRIISKPVDGNHGNIHPKSSDYVTEGIPFVMANDIRQGILDWKNATKISKAQADRLQKGFSYTGDVLLTHKGSVGNTAIVPAIDSDYIMLTPQVTYYRVTDHSKLHGPFLRYIFDTEIFQEEFRIKSGGGTRAYIGITEQAKLKINLPSVDEQERIADYITEVDSRLTNTRAKMTAMREYKNGVMQALFSGKLRFKDENGNPYPSWEIKKLRHVLQESNEKTVISNQYEALSSTNRGLYKQSEYFNKEIASSNNTGYKVLRINQIVFSPQNLWMGNINLNSKFKVGMVSPSYKIFDVDGAVIGFIANIIKSPRMMFEYAQASEQGASIVRRNLDIDSFLNIKIDMPNNDEQQKIADFLAALDDKIKLEEAKLASTKEFKKALLQRMFV